MSASNKILISIIIPVFNRIYHLKNLLDSLNFQKQKYFEIIIVDDGSSENIENQIKNYNKMTIKYFKIMNSERGKARNYGMLKSTGTYINYFDSDDIALPNHVQIAIETIKEYNFPNVFHLAYEKYNLKNKKIKKIVFKKKFINSYILKKNVLSCNGVFLKREVALENLFCENRLLSGSEDWELWLRLCKKYKILSISIITSCVMEHGERSVNFNNYFDLKIRLELFNSLINDKNRHNLSQREIHVVYSEVQMYLALYASVIKSNRIVTIKHLIFSIRLNTRIMFSLKFFVVIRNLFFKI